MDFKSLRRHATCIKPLITHANFFFEISLLESRPSEKPCLVQGELSHREQQARHKYEEKLLSAGVSPSHQKFDTISIPQVVEKGRNLR